MTRTLKVLVFIAVLIIAILGISLYANSLLGRSASKMQDQLLLIESSAAKDDWQEAHKEIVRMQKDWSDTKKTWATLIDHFEIDNIENAMVRLQKYIDTNEKSLTLAEIATLKQYVKHIPSMVSPRLENIF